MQYISPEKAGVSSANVQRFIDFLEKNQLSTHNVILSRGNDIFFEKYWEPFHPGFLHRMYSVSKSFVSLAIGFLEQEGKLDLDAPVTRYFPEEMEKQTDENFRNMTIRHMLMMSTAKPGQNWFTARIPDRVRYYFENDCPQSRPAGTVFEYDSTGSFVMGALVERITGMKFMEYLRGKLFEKIGVSQEAHCLTCPGGHSWGDSAVLCTPRDLWHVARFVLNKGSWNGEQILNREYLELATTRQIDNDNWQTVNYDTCGYGYQFWMTYQNSFAFVGMGGQYAICVPDKDLILVINGDNQGKEIAGKLVFDSFFEYIVNPAVKESLPEDESAQAQLEAATADLKLAYAQGETHSDWEKEINDITYVLDPNPMGITRMKLHLEKDQGTLFYTNAQGDKELSFGLGKNVFGLFPQEGYSDQTGSVSAPGHFYKCAASAAWVEAKKLFLKVQIIDDYFGNLSIVMGFRDDHRLGIYMCKCAEDFLDEYTGFASGRRSVQDVTF